MKKVGCNQEPVSDWSWLNDCPNPDRHEISMDRKEKNMYSLQKLQTGIIFCVILKLRNSSVL